jgi:hypothetical protein
MFNFKQLVESLLIVEVFNPSILDGVLNQTKTTQNEWLYKLLKLHSNLFPSIPIDATILTNCFSRALGSYNAKPKANILRDVAPLERIYDVLYTVVQQTKSKFQATTIADFANNSDVKNSGEAIYSSIPSNGPWELKNPDVINAYNALMNERDLLAKAALETYFKKSILQTVNEAVKKRTDVFSRLSVVRTPFGQPFANLLKDALINPEQYASGNKKVTDDFKQIVDDLYFKQIITVGLAAKDFFKKNTGQTAINNADYAKMLNNESGGYTIEDINNMGTKESITLIDSLRSIAEYERKKVGRGERLKFAGQAMSALAGLGGATLYGGQ